MLYFDFSKYKIISLIDWIEQKVSLLPMLLGEVYYLFSVSIYDILDVEL
jgi:hypothetical protein